MPRIRRALVLSFLLGGLASCNAVPSTSEASAKPAESVQAYLREDVAVLDEPWAIAFVPGTRHAVVSERAGRLKLLGADGILGEVAGAPEVDYGGQGGLGDVVFAPAALDRIKDDAAWPLYLSWVEAGPGDTRGAVVGRGEFLIDQRKGAAEIRGLEVIWRQKPKVTGRGHYSHRLAFSPDGRHLFVASGDRQKLAPAQDLSSNLGKILRLMPDGSPAPGNPFAARGGAAAEVWSYGHRNILGLAFAGDGRLWAMEHGPAGGDELNLIRPGVNYGWPVVSEGDHYSGKDIPPHASRPELAAPALSWSPVIAPGGFILYSGALFPGWRGQALFAGLKSETLVIARIDGERASETARLPMRKRLRAVAEAPDGAVWVAEDGHSARVFRLTPPPAGARR